MGTTVERYRKPTRILHWVHAASFIILFFTGLILFVPGLGFLAEDGWTRLIHRGAAGLFVIAPLIYLSLNFKATLKGVREAFIWQSGDIGWLKAAPRYYFLNDEAAMPPQGHMNTGQKMWWFLVIVFGLVFVASGVMMWFFKTTLPRDVIQWMVAVHDVSFIATGIMFLVHVYMSVMHPLTRPAKTGAWNSMAHGSVSVEYARSHHGAWYKEITESKKPGAV